MLAPEIDRRLFLAAALTLIATTAWGAAEGTDRRNADEDARAPTAIVGAKLIDGTGAEPLENAVVVIRGDRIATVGAAGDVDVPDSADVIDAAGQVVMPGLVDLHIHYGGGEEGLRRQFVIQLEFGVTTARSLGADGEANVALMHAANAGELPAPRLYTAGRGFSHAGGLPPGVPIINRPETTDQAREMVRGLATQGVHLVKMWVDGTLDGSFAMGPLPKIAAQIRTAIVEEAAAHGIPAVAHIYDEADVRQLNAAGVVHFVHTVRSAPVDDAFTEWASAQGLTFAPALSKAQDSWYFPENPTELDDPGLVKSFGEARIAWLKTPDRQVEMLANPQGPQLRRVYAHMQRFVKQMQDGGVTIAVGSDSGAGNVAFGWGAHHEMKLLVEAGLTPLQALTAGTGNGAYVLEGDDAEFGTIRAGKVADLLLLDADPTVDINNTRRIARVMQAGVWLQDG